MSKFYAQWRRPKRVERKWRIHPIWRGIGCFMVLLIPVMSYAAAHFLVLYNLEEGWFPIPREFTGPVAYPYLYAKLMVAAVVMVTLFGIFTLVYTMIYSMLGPPQYGPLDATPKDAVRDQRARRRREKERKERRRKQRSR